MGKRGEFGSIGGLFVTGCDTGVGKTVVTGAIGHVLARGGGSVGVFKPIATGCEHRREGLVSRDAEFLAHWADVSYSLETVNPIRYREPLAPLVAAERAGRPIDWEQVGLAYKNVCDSTDMVLVEGIGGVMVPIEKDYLVLDMMEDMALPVVIVARPGLGTINHTLLSVYACQSRGLTVVGVVINGYRAETADLAQESNPGVIAEAAKLPVLAVIPYDEGSCVERGLLGGDTIASVAQINWNEVIGRHVGKQRRVK